MLNMSAISPRNFLITLISTTVTAVNIAVSFQLIILTVLQQHQVSHNGKSILPLNQQEQSAEETKLSHTNQQTAIISNYVYQHLFSSKRYLYMELA